MLTKIHPGGEGGGEGEGGRGRGAREGGRKGGREDVTQYQSTHEPFFLTLKHLPAPYATVHDTI